MTNNNKQFGLYRYNDALMFIAIVKIIELRIIMWVVRGGGG